LAAYLLDYHRREGKATWWEYFRLRGLSAEDLYDERQAVAGVRFVERVGPVIGKRGKPTRSVVDRYAFPAQEMEIERGASVWLQDGNRFGAVIGVDRSRNTIDVEKGPSRADVHPAALFAFSHVSPAALEDALHRLGEAIAGGTPEFGAARSLLAGSAPRLRSAEFGLPSGVSATDYAVRIATDLSDTVLAIQGPPGAGKTHCGARMILQLVAAGARVGVTANSHKVIQTLLMAVERAGRALGQTIRLAHKWDEDQAEPPAGDAAEIAALTSNAEALEAVRSTDVDVVGGTSWLWARPEMAESLDVLFVDEAGQLSLANALAVSLAARSLVLLGDPQQLEQPRKGSHPPGVDVSALEQMLGDHQTIPIDRGLFLAETWRLPPSICEFTSELFYEGRLMPHDRLGMRRVAGVSGVPTHGLAFAPVVHDGNRNWSSEEVDAVALLVSRLVADGTLVDATGGERALAGSDILVVAPYNAHVTRLADRLAGTGVRTGTVDKFQGQEAPVVIYSMATSVPEDAPRGMEFLYSRNRLNVAMSRAQCLAVLVASPRLFEAECATPRQMLLASSLCRFREMAATVDLVE
jgi:uncharacterized protein